MSDKPPVSALAGLENAANLVKEKSELTVEKIQNIEQATMFIKDNENKITNAWFSLAHALKKVRDEQLYSVRYENFEEYYKNELNYAKTMVYNFIKVAENFPLTTKDELINLGITKLIDLTQIDNEKREEFIENNNLQEMSSKQIKEKIKQNNKPKLSNQGKEFYLEEEEYKTIQKLNGDFNGFKNIIEEIATNDEHAKLTHEKAIYLNNMLEVAKKEMLKMEKMIKKYI